MLEQVLAFIHNYFEVATYRGEITIADGTLETDLLQPGQYFRIKGSIFNDGVHQYPSADLHDEVFIGEVRAMAVPPAVIALAADIQDWLDKYGSVVQSPFSSESFANYSYSKATGGAGQGSAGDAITWQSVFARQLNQWRKIS